MSTNLGPYQDNGRLAKAYTKSNHPGAEFVEASENGNILMRRGNRYFHAKAKELTAFATLNNMDKGHNADVRAEKQTIAHNLDQNVIDSMAESLDNEGVPSKHYTDAIKNSTTLQEKHDNFMNLKEQYKNNVLASREKEKEKFKQKVDKHNAALKSQKEK